MAPSRLIFTLAFGAISLASTVLTAGTIVSARNEPDNPNLPADATPQSCYGREIVPAVIETVTESVQLTLATTEIDPQTGETRVVKPATFGTKTVQRMVRDRSEIWFETICPQIYTERFVKSLQRALQARGFYSGTPTGWMDPETNIAIKLYQRQDNIDSDILARKTAEAFGLISHRDFNKFRGNSN